MSIETLAVDRPWLMLGDCLERMREIPDGSVDAVVTDPPYKISQEYSANADPDNLLAVSSIWPTTAEAYRVCKPGSLMVMFYDTRILPLALAAAQHAGWKYMRALTFYRRWGNACMMNGWMSTSDFALVFYKPGQRPVFNGPAKHDVFVREKKEAESTGHPAQKPLEFVENIVRNVCPEGGVVLDMYSGSGTTGVSCAVSGRAFIGIERDPDYFEIMARRITDAATATQPAPKGGLFDAQAAE